MRRFLKWSRRHRSAVSILVGSVMLLIYLATSLPEVVKEAELRLANTVREHIEFAAKAQAGAALNEVRTRVERVTNMLRDPEVIALHAHGDLFDPPRALQRHAEGFDSVFILTLKGSPVARYPQPRPEYAGRGFGGRDYVKRAQRLLERGLDGVQVSRLFESVADGDIKLAYSAVLRRDDGEPVGILAATTSARSTFGSLTMQCPGAIGCTTYLFGPPDAAPGVAEPPQNELLLVAGKGLEKGKRTQLPEQVAAEVCAAIGCGSTTLDQFAAREGQESFVYTGDIPGITNGPSLTAFASVAQTGLVVAVAVPQKEALASVRNLRQRLRENLYAPLGLGIVLFLALTLDWSGLQMWLARRWTSRSR